MQRTTVGNIGASLGAGYGEAIMNRKIHALSEKTGEDEWRKRERINTASVQARPSPSYRLHIKPITGERIGQENPCISCASSGGLYGVTYENSLALALECLRNRSSVVQIMLERRSFTRVL